VYSKHIHTNLYQNAKSHNHPSNKQAVLYTLVHRVRALCEDTLQAEATTTGRSRALNHHTHLDKPENKPNSVAFLPFVGPIFNRSSRVLARHNITSVGLLHMKLINHLRTVKDNLGLRTPGVYRIPCGRGRVY
jgi:hypothetical protein